MKKVFISYSRRNLNVVERLARDLQDAGLEVWVDFRKIKGGEAWRQAIYNGIDESEFVIACLSAPAAESEWVRRELEIAQNKKKLIIPVMLERAFEAIEKYPETKVLLDVQIINFAELNYERAFPTLLSSLPGREQTANYDDIDPSLIPNPFKGLESFQETDNEFFFGRDALIEKAVTRLFEIVDKNEDARFMAFVGASGSGKSSVVRAGIIPAIREGRLPGSDDYPIIIFKPGANPIEALASRLLPLVGDVSVEMMIERLGESHRALDEITRELMVEAPPEDRFVIVIDQFEEVFTRVDYEIQLQFLDLLYEAVTSKNGRALILITMRADFFDRLSHFPLLAALFGHNNLIIVADMSSDELRHTIEGPAIAVGLVYDHGLPDRILEEVLQQPGSLPLLQYALSQIFELRDRRRLTWDAYNSIGGVRQALARHAENVYRRLNSAQQDLMQRLLLRLVEVSETGETTRRRVQRDELSFERVSENALNELLDLMTSSSVRLLVSSRELRSDQDPDEAKPIVWIEVVHEALIREWSRFLNWVHDDEENLRISTEIMKTALEWDNAGRDASYLLTQSRLDRAMVWVQTADASQLQRDFVNISAEARRKQEMTDREQQAYVATLELASRRRLRWLVAVLFVGILISVAFLIRSFFSEQAAISAQLAAERGAAINRSIGLSNEARLHPRNGDDPFLGIAYAIEANFGTDIPAPAQQTLAEITWQAGARRRLLGHDTLVWTAVYSPDGRYILSGAGDTPSDSSLILWDAQSGAELGRFVGHTDRVYTVAFSPDGSLAASGSQDSSVIIWDVATRTIVHNLGAGSAAGHSLDVWTVRFTPDGEQLVSGDSSGRIIIWDVASGDIVHDFRNIHSAHVEDIDFSEDGQFVVTGSDDASVKVWNLNTGVVLHSFTAPNYVLGVSFLPDEKAVVSADYSGQINFWDLETESASRSITIDNATPLRGGLVLSRDGQTLIVGDDLGNIFFYAVNSNSDRPFQEFHGHDKSVTRLAMSPDESSLVSASYDESLIIWDLQGRGAEVSRFNAGEAIQNAVLSPDGSLIAASLEDGRVQLWTSDWHSRQSFALNAGRVYQLAFSPDGTLLAAVAENGSVTIWTLSGASILQQFTDSQAPMRTLAFSPDGTLLAAAGGQVQVSPERPMDNSVWIWDVASGEVVKQLDGQHNAAIRSIAFSPDGSQLLSASDDSTIVLWDVASGDFVRRYDEHTDTVWAVAFSPDGSQFISGSSDAHIILWNTATGAVERRLSGHNTAVRALAFSPDGRHALSGSGTVQTLSVGEDYKLRYWDLQTGELLREFPGHSAMISSLNFNSSGNQALSSSQDGKLIIWRVESVEELMSRIAANYDVFCVPNHTNTYCQEDTHAAQEAENTGTENHRFPIQATAAPTYTEDSLCLLSQNEYSPAADEVDTSAFRHEAPYRIGYSDSGIVGTSHAWILAWAHFAADNQEDVEIFLSRDAGGDEEQQLADIDALIAADIDILIVHPVETSNMQALEAKIEEVTSSGIAVVMVGFRTANPVYTAYVGQDDYEVGCIMAQELIALADGEGDIIRIHAVNEAPADNAFKAGASAVLEMYPNINLLNEAGVDFDQRRAYNLVAGNNSFSDLSALLGFTGDLAVGGEQGLLMTGRSLAPVVSDHDLNLSRFIMEHKIEGAQVRVTVQMGSTAVDTALSILRGEPVSRFVRIRPEVIHADDLADINFSTAPLSGYIGDYADLPALYWPQD